MRGVEKGHREAQRVEFPDVVGEDALALPESLTERLCWLALDGAGEQPGGLFSHRDIP